MPARELHPRRPLFGGRDAHRRFRVHNGHDGDLLSDYGEWLEELAPHTPASHYFLCRTGEDNADALMRRQIMDREAVRAVTEGRRDTGIR